MSKTIVFVFTGIVVGTGLQAWVAYINLFCYYIIGLPLALVMGWISHLGVSVHFAMFLFVIAPIKSIFNRLAKPFLGLFFIPKFTPPINK